MKKQGGGGMGSEKEESKGKRRSRITRMAARGGRMDEVGMANGFVI